MRTYTLSLTIALLACIFCAHQGKGQYVVDTSWGYNPTYDPATQSAPSGATTVNLSDDDYTSPLSIGFSFPYFGDTYTQFQISSNGFLTLGSSLIDDHCCSADSIPDSADPNDQVAFCREDIDPGNGGTISYITEGSSPNQRLVVTYHEVPHYPSGNEVTQQVILHEDGIIEMQTTIMPSDGEPHTMGIEDSTGTQGFAHPERNLTDWSDSTDATRFIPDSVASVGKHSPSEAEVQVHPNPSNGPVQVKLENKHGKADVQLVGPRGRILKEYKDLEGRSRFTLDEELFNGSGIYFLKISSANGQKVEKIVRTD